MPIKPNSLATGMARRNIPKGLDFYPTPGWATRALMETFRNCPRLGVKVSEYPNTTVWDPAAGRGHMSDVLGEYFATVHASDIHDYGRQDIAVEDFLTDSLKAPVENNSWIITNPPFSLAEKFALRCLEIREWYAFSQPKFALLCRIQWVETKGRYDKLFKDNPPSYVFPFVERIQFMPGRVLRNKDCPGGATAYAWFVWVPWLKHSTEMIWIPPCMKELEKDSDYDE